MTDQTAQHRVDDPTGGHPFPQLRRPAWKDLRGVWGFAYDDDDRGLEDGWCEHGSFERRIVVPFPPESPASTINDNGYHPIVWYSRHLNEQELREAGIDHQGDRTLLHFGAVDYHATVWLNGSLVGTHEGGHTPFAFDITRSLTAGTNLLVVRAEDQPTDVSQPRGKQDWMIDAHGIWYNRTTGIWQTVWLETVPPLHIRTIAWMPARNSDAVQIELGLSSTPPKDSQVSVQLSFEGEFLANQIVRIDGSRSPILTVELAGQRHGQHYDKLQWSPEHPRLIDATITLSPPDGSADEIQSYFGLRTVGTRAGEFLLNDSPYYVRSVLEQGYWPQSHLAAPDDAALRSEVELIKSLGFNAARLHQKIEDPRFHYWSDRLGLLLWCEAPATYEFSTGATIRLLQEWTDCVCRDRSHPSVVTWVPVNESWGVHHLSVEPAQRAFTRAIADLTRALDPTRPVISNDGWEHTDSDILTIHDYSDPASQIARYRDSDTLAKLFRGYGPANHLLLAEGEADLERPVMVSEFGGIRFEADPDSSSWGYSTASSAEEFEACLRKTFEALQASPVLSGFCYTQLTDTMQEANGLTDENRNPKLPIETIRAIVLGKSG